MTARTAAKTVVGSTAAKKRTKKQDELSSRAKADPPPRGADAAPKIEAGLRDAKHRADLQVQAKQVEAAKHNSKAESVVVETREARRHKEEKAKEDLEHDLLAHAARHEEEVQRVREKAAAEVEKVHTKAAALQETLAETAEKERHAIDESMQAAAERRAKQVGEVVAKGHQESVKVEKAASKVQEKTKSKAAKQAAKQAAAEERHAAKVGEIAAKGAEEVAKVAAVGYLGGAVSPTRGGETIDPTTPGTGEVGGKYRAPERPSPPPITMDGAKLMLKLMQAGTVPNEEVLRANTVDEYFALGVKYQIALEP